MSSEYVSLRKKRIAVAFVGVIVGLLVGAPITYWLYGVWFNATTFAFCCAGAASALSYAERQKKIIKSEDLKWLTLRKQAKPLGISSADSTNRGDGKQKL